MTKRRRNGIRQQERAAGTREKGTFVRRIELGDDRARAVARFGVYLTVVRQGKGATSMDALRQLKSLREVIDAAADDNPDAKLQKLKEGVAELVLDEVQFKILLGRFENAGIEWNPNASEKVLDAYDTAVAAKKEPRLTVETVVEPTPAAPRKRAPRKRAAG